MKPIGRRILLQTTALQAIAASLGGCRPLFSSDARLAQGSEGSGASGGSQFTAEQRLCLEAAGEILAPGAARAGLISFIDSQLALEPGDSLLFIKYLDQPPPWGDFYRAMAVGLDRASEDLYGQHLKGLAESDATQMIRRLRDEQLPGWKGPSPSLAYAVLRSDAIDVVYGTQAGFDSLDVPYMAHIEPPSNW